MSNLLQMQKIVKLSQIISEKIPPLFLDTFYQSVVENSFIVSITVTFMKPSIFKVPTSQVRLQLI